MWKHNEEIFSGDACVAAGIYRSTCADLARVTMAEGEKLPPCPACYKRVGWRLAAAT